MLGQMLEKLGFEPVFKKLPYPIAIRMAGLMEFYSKWMSRREPVLTRYSVGILAKDMTLNTDLAQKELGYSPKMTVEEAMDEFVNWWKNRPTVS